MARTNIGKMRIFRNINKKMAYALLLLFCLFMSGCTREDLSECEYFLRFRYDYNIPGKDLFADQVEQVKVFVFDPQGNYLSTFSESGQSLKSADYKMRIPYELYGCKFVVWAGRTDRFYALAELSAGDRMDKLTLGYCPQGATCSVQIDDLWYSGPSVMTFLEDHGSTQTVSLVRNTNDFQVGLQDKSGTPLASGYRIKITSANGFYKYDNTYPVENPLITYLPFGLTDDGKACAQFRTLRLVENHQMQLSVTDANGQPVRIGQHTSIELTDYLLMSMPQGMSAQEYLDRRYQWDIGLIIDRSDALAITINGWVYWFHGIDQ